LTIGGGKAFVKETTIDFDITGMNVVLVDDVFFTAAPYARG